MQGWASTDPATGEATVPTFEPLLEIFPGRPLGFQVRGVVCYGFSPRMSWSFFWGYI